MEFYELEYKYREDGEEKTSFVRLTDEAKQRVELPSRVLNNVKHKVYLSIREESWELEFEPDNDGKIMGSAYPMRTFRRKVFIF